MSLYTRYILSELAFTPEMLAARRHQQYGDNPDASAIPVGSMSSSMPPYQPGARDGAAAPMINPRAMAPAATAAPAATSTAATAAPAATPTAATAAAPVTGAAPGGTGGWVAPDYPNAPTEWKMGISHPERNNPGNLRVGGNKWQGATTKPGDSFESFDTMQNGLRARAMTYQSYIKRGVNTIDQISNTSGPASDGNNIASQNAAYGQAMGGKYAEPGGEHLPIDMTPDNIRRLVVGGVSIENGGDGKFLPKGIPMDMINSTVGDLVDNGHFGTQPASQVASSAPSGTPMATPASPTAQPGATSQASAQPGAQPFFRDPRGIASGAAMGRPDMDPRIAGWINKAGESLPPGYYAQLRAGPGNHTWGTYTSGNQAASQVPKGQAADLDIFDDKGRRLINPVDTKDDADFGMYKKLGDAYIQASGGQGRWGGNYSRPDRMQYGTVSDGYPAGANADPAAYAQARQAATGNQTQVAQANTGSSTSPPNNQQAAATPTPPPTVSALPNPQVAAATPPPSTPPPSTPPPNQQAAANTPSLSQQMAAPLTPATEGYRRPAIQILRPLNMDSWY